MDRAGQKQHVDKLNVVYRAFMRQPLQHQNTMSAAPEN